MTTGVRATRAGGNDLGWEVAAGSVQGRDHRQLGRNNQDALAVVTAPNALVAVVSDGCGSAPASEVGAHLVAQLVAAALLRAAPRLDPAADPACALRAVLSEASEAVLAHLYVLAQSFPRGADAAVREHLLATFVAAVVTPSFAALVRLGDGVCVVDGRVERAAYPDDAPPYLAYALLGDGPVTAASPDLQPTVVWGGTPDAVRTLAIATDGAADLLTRAADRIPGSDEPVGTLAEWAADDRLFANPQALTRRLTRIARDHQRLDWVAHRAERTAGLLHDDTTLVLLRRSARAKSGAPPPRMSAR